MDGRLVTVAVQDGIVTLTGKVDNLLARDRAAEIAGAIRGVRSVSNQITVDPIARADKQIQNKVNRMIARNPTTESFQINASVNNGVVLMTGKVDSWAEQDLATTVAKSIPGVREVRNKIEVDFTKSRPDKEIEADVRSRLIWDTLVDDELIFVDVKDGVVFLKGTVGSVMEQGRARSDAWVLGVNGSISAAWRSNRGRVTKCDKENSPTPRIRRSPMPSCKHLYLTREWLNSTRGSRCVTAKSF